jgi:ribosomal protein S12 methylthiotransferase accessory factor
MAAAKASGIMESTEFFHAEHIRLPLLLASYEELRYSHRVIDVMEVPRTSKDAFHPDLPFLWIEGFDLLQQEHVWLPFASVHCNYVFPMPVSMGCFPVTSIGLASGNHLYEAISHAISEVIEHDASALWGFLNAEEKERTRLDLRTCDDEACCQVIERCQQAGVNVAVWDITSDIGLPAFSCIIAEKTDDPIRLLYAAGGEGCHPTRGIALLRALTEAVQSRLTIISGARDDMFHSHYERERNRDRLNYFRSLMQSGEGTIPLRSFQDVPTFDGAETFDEDIECELNQLHAAGIQRVVAIDLTKPEFRLPVVRVVIPGLEAAEEIADTILGQRAQAAMERSSRL